MSQPDTFGEINANIYIPLNHDRRIKKAKDAIKLLLNCSNLIACVKPIKLPDQRSLFMHSLWNGLLKGTQMPLVSDRLIAMQPFDMIQMKHIFLSLVICKSLKTLIEMHDQSLWSCIWRFYVSIAAVVRPFKHRTIWWISCRALIIYLTHLMQMIMRVSPLFTKQT